MVFQLANEICCIKHCWGVYEHDSIVNSVFADDWLAELAIIANNVMSTLRWLFVILWANLFSFQSYIIRLCQENPDHLL